jgi:hypothetical protein
MSFACIFVDFVNQDTTFYQAGGGSQDNLALHVRSREIEETNIVDRQSGDMWASY